VKPAEDAANALAAGRLASAAAQRTTSRILLEADDILLSLFAVTLKIARSF